jgi:hypothetical protein
VKPISNYRKQARLRRFSIIAASFGTADGSVGASRSGSPQRLSVENFTGSGCRRCPRPCPRRLQRFPYPLERRRPRHPHPEGCQGGVREAAIDSVTVQRHRPVHTEHEFSTGVNRWDEKAGLRRDAIRSQVIDVLEAQIKRRPAMKKVSTVTAAQSRNISQQKLQRSAGPLWGLLKTFLEQLGKASVCSTRIISSGKRASLFIRASAGLY